MKTIIAVIDKKGKKAPSMVTAILRGPNSTMATDLAVALPPTPFIQRNVHELRIKNLNSRTALGYSPTSGHVGELKIVSLLDATLVFCGRIYFPPSISSFLNGSVARKRLSSDQVSNWLLKEPRATILL